MNLRQIQRRNSERARSRASDKAPRSGLGILMAAHYKYMAEVHERLAKVQEARERELMDWFNGLGSYSAT